MLDFQSGVWKAWDEKMLKFSRIAKACSFTREEDKDVDRWGGRHTLFCHHMCKALRRRKQEGVREHSISIHFGIVMIHVVPETENMTSEHTKFTLSFLMNRRLLITAVSSKITTYILLLLVKARKTSSLMWTNGPQAKIVWQSIPFHWTCLHIC